LERVERQSATEYTAMSDAALAWSKRFDWATIARETIATYQQALQD